MIVLATIGAKALYLLFAWLVSAAGAAWLAERKGYGERMGLAFGLILSAAGLLVMLLLPGRPNSWWRLELTPRVRAAPGATYRWLRNLPGGLARLPGAIGRLLRRRDG